MKPYYSEAGITIYHGDCREILPTLEVIDVIVADPPFFMPAQISQSRKPWPRTLADFAVMAGYYRDVFADCVRQLTQKGAFYSFCDSSSYAVFFSVVYPLFARTHCLVWDKEVGGLGNGWRHSHELILHGALAATEYDPGFRLDVLGERPLQSEVRFHPSEKPEALTGRLIRAHPVGTVLDPFMGAGGVIVAAKNVGRKAIGIEIEEKYCEIAAKRLSQSVMNFGAAK